jgi:hypothetical protein
VSERGGFRSSARVAIHRSQRDHDDEHHRHTHRRRSRSDSTSPPRFPFMIITVPCRARRETQRDAWSRATMTLSMTLFEPCRFLGVGSDWQHV